MQAALHLVERDTCRGDGICVEICPEDVLEITDGKAATVETHVDSCIECGQCVAICPTESLQMPQLPSSDFVELTPPGFSYDQFHDFLRSRRSVRAFRDEPVVQDQIDCLEDIGAALGNDNGRLWQMTNGYALATEEGLKEIRNRLGDASDPELNDLRELLRIGIQWNTEVTISESRHTVSQAYSSALPVAYSHHSQDLWEPFARLILEAAYEATLCAGILNRIENDNKTVFLTLVGGGAFGNDKGWIIAAIHRAIDHHRDSGLDVRIASYQRPDPQIADLVKSCSA